MVNAELIDTLQKLSRELGFQINVENARVVCLIDREGLQIVLTVPNDVLEWNIDATEAASSLVASDWCDYTGYDETPIDRLRQEMSRDVLQLVDGLMHRQLRMTGVSKQRRQLEWHREGTWQSLIPLSVHAL